MCHEYVVDAATGSRRLLHYSSVGPVQPNPWRKSACAHPQHDGIAGLDAKAPDVQVPERNCSRCSGAILQETALIPGRDGNIAGTLSQRERVGPCAICKGAA